MSETTTATAARWIEAGGIRTHFHDVGSGDVVLLLHGSGPGVSAWANWRHTIPTLGQQYRVLAPDIVGYGATDRPADVRYSLRTWTNHIWALLDAVDVERVSVIGNSLGGRIAMQMAEDDESRLHRLVLMGAPGLGMEVTDGLRALRSYEPSREAMRDLLVKYFAVDPSIITDELVTERYEASAIPAVREAYHAMFFDPSHAGNELGISEDQLRAINVPCLLVHGREDKVVPPGVAWQTAQAIPNADLHTFARCGHWTQIERAAEFNRLVADYLCVEEARR